MEMLPFFQRTATKNVANFLQSGYSFELTAQHSLLLVLMLNANPMFESILSHPQHGKS